MRSDVTRLFDRRLRELYAISDQLGWLHGKQQTDGQADQILDDYEAERETDDGQR